MPSTAESSKVHAPSVDTGSKQSTPRREEGQSTIDPGDPRDDLTHALFAQRATGVALLSLDGRYRAVNDTLCELLGRPEEKLRGLLWSDVTHPDDLGAFEQLRRSVEANPAYDRYLDGEKRYLRPDGEVRWAIVGTSIVRDVSGAATGFLSQVVDITRRKQADEALRRERQHMEAVSAVALAANEATDVGYVQRVALNTLCTVAGWPLAHIAYVDPPHLRSADVRVSVDPDATGSFERSLARRPIVEAGAAGRAAAGARHHWSDAPSSTSAAAPFRWHGAWPIRSGGGVAAVLECWTDEMDPSLVRLVTAVCAQLGQTMDRLAATARLKARERQLHQAQEMARLGSWRWDVTTGALDATDIVYDIFGLDRDAVSMTFQTVVDHLHPADVDRVMAEVDRCLKDGQRIDIDCRIVRSDGETRHLQGSAEIIRDPSGEVRHLVGASQDVTEHAHAVEALRDSEERVRLVLETSSDAFVEYDRDCLVLEWNPAASRIFGWTAEEAKGRDVTELLCPDGDDGAHLARLLTDIDSEAVGASQEGVALRKGGSTLPVELTIPPTPHAVVRSAFLRDISERKRSEWVLKEANVTLRNSVTALERRSREVTLLNEMIDLLQSSTGMDEGFRVLTRHAEQLFPEAAGAVYVSSDDPDAVRLASAWGGYTPLESKVWHDDCWALRRGRVHRTEPGPSPLYCPHARYERGGTICVPMLSDGAISGLVHLRTEHGTGVGVPEGRELLLTDFAERTALALANFELRERLRVQSIRDSLTGLYNRRYMEETFERELHRAQRKDYPLGVALLDLDHFKDFNDRFGHQVGDEVLRAVGGYLQTVVRADDVVCRYGGEEFLLLAPGATLEQMVERCEQVRVGLLALTLPDAAAGSQQTASIGVAAYPDHGDETGTLLRAADRALYVGKHDGRNRVVAAGADRMA